MAPPKDIARSYPKRGITADVGFRSEPKFCGDGSTEFDGSADELSTTATLSVATVPIQTFCVWVKPSTVNANRGIVVNGLSNTNDAFYLYQYLTGYGQASNTSSPGQSRNFALNSVKQDQWQFLCGVYDATDPASVSFSLYVDGVSYSDTAPLGTGAVSGFFKVGRSSSGYFAGKIANVKVFDVALTQDQVRELYNNPGLTTPTGVNSSNLRRHYELETNFNDSGADSENLTSAGSPSFTVDRPQLPRGLDLARGAAQARVYTGRAIELDGSADYLDIGQKDFGTGDFSISLWFYDQQSSGGNRSLYSKGTYNTVGGLLIYNTYGATGTGEYLMFRNDAQATGGFDSRIMFTSEATPDQWHHIAVTRTGGTVKTYFDGKIANTSTNFNPAWDINASLNSFIGARDPSSPGSFWDGFISSVKVWDTVLTDAQVAEQFHNPEQVLPTGTSASNLDRYYPLSDYNDTGGTGGRYFQDMGADGEPAVDQGSATMAFAQPVPCPQLGLQQSATRLYHPGASQGATATIAAPGTTVSLSVWIFWDQARLSYPINLGDAASSSGDGLNIRIDGTGQITMYQSGGPLLSGLTITEGEWNHIVVATRSDSPYWRCWLNNSEASSPDALVNTVNITSTNCNLGMSNYILGMGGIANDAAVWNTELGDSDVAALYNSGVQGMDVSTVQSANLLGWWKFDDLTTLKDYSGNGANAAVTGTFVAASFPENASGSTIVGDFSMKRKGVSVLNAPGSGRATLAANASLLPTTGGGYTLCAFVRLQSTDNDAAVIMSTSTGANEWGTFYEGSTNKYKIVLSDGTTNILDRAFTGTVTDSEWHHIAWTIQLDAVTATGETYLDGAPDLSFTRSSFNTPPTPSEFAIGYDPGNADKQANAAIACLRIYQSVLSANEIEQIYRSDLRLIKGLENE